MANADQAKKTRAIAKATLTRISNTLKMLIHAERPVDEMLEAESKFKVAFENVLKCHDEYLMLLDIDKIDDEFGWIDDVTGGVDKLTLCINDYKSHFAPVVTTVSVTVTTGATTGVTSPTSTTSSATTTTSGTATTSSATASGSVTSSSTNPSSRLRLRTEKAPLPKFSGNVIEYFDFKRDFKFLVDGRHTPEESLYILKTCLGQKPADWIQGERVYESAWVALDDKYGNPRLASDVLIGTLNRFKSVPDNDLAQFIELHHLIKRIYNALSEIKRTADIDNSTTIGLIEKKLHYADRLKWAAHQQAKTIQPSIETLLAWMKGEIWIRQVAGAEIRSSKPTQAKHAVNVTGTSEVASHQNTVTLHKDKINRPMSGQKSADYIDSRDSKVSNWPCWVCKQQHKPHECEKFKAMGLETRLTEVRKARACYFCLRCHRGSCRLRKRCEINIDGKDCPYSHHPLLHGAPFDRVGTYTSVMSCSENLLPVLRVTGFNPKTISSKTGTLLFDSGSQLSLIRADFARELGLEGMDIVIRIVTVGGREELFETKAYKLQVQAVDGSSRYSLKVIAIPKIGEDIKTVNPKQWSGVLENHAATLNRGSGPVDILIGIDHAKFHTGNTEVLEQFALRNSILGPVIFGSTSIDPEKTFSLYHVALPEPVDITAFWTSEQMGVALNPCCSKPKRGEKFMTPMEKTEAKMIRESAKKVGNQWRIPLPWHRDPEELPDNYTQVKAKLISTEKRLQKNPEYAKMYDDQVKDLVKRGCALKLTQEDIRQHTGPVHYISHHAVLCPEKKSTPCRLVFNSAASFQGHVLNKYLCKGPDLLNNLVGVLTRFRENPVAIVGDVSKMYHQILVDPVRDAHTHRFLWRNFEIRPPDIYVKQVLTFGDISSPALANTALDLTAEEYEGRLPVAVATIKHCRYMDDICDSLSTTSEAIKRAGEVDEILDSGHFKIKEWMSNRPLIQEDKNSKFGTEWKPSDEKVLGVIWDRVHDELSVSVKPPPWKIPDKLTKRLVLSALAGVFDVIGLVAPVILVAKIWLQELWKDNYQWDESLPKPVKQKWMTWFEDLQSLKEYKIERCLTPPNYEGRPMLVIFCDASLNGFGTVAYIRWKTSEGYQTRFIIAKSRVAPLKPLTIPRLELQAAVMASRLNETILTETRFELEKTVIFSDSMIVLAWIRQEPRSFKTFVSHRIGEIQMKTGVEDWRYCPTELNIADDVSRGRSVDELTETWKCGPEFLRLPEDEWPATPDAREGQEENERKTNCQVLNVCTVAPILDRMGKFSSQMRAIRVTATLTRFVQNLRSKSKKLPINTEPLSLDELRAAEKKQLIHAQSTLHPMLGKPELASLSPFVDEDGIIRVGGRVGKALVSYNTQHPALLPYDHWYSRLIVQRAHWHGHSGVAATAAKVRRKYWIMSVTRIAKVVKYRCGFCRKMAAQAETQIMSDLPALRLQPLTPPFHNTALDLFGPYKIRITRNKHDKCYAVLFTCLNTRAVSLDLTMDYSTMEFLQTLRRFFSLRGTPETILSDQGPQLLGSAPTVREWCCEKGTKWQFCTPTAAHHNGCAEALVRSCKTALKHAIGEQVLSALELQTVLFEVANLVNERPIGRSSNDPDDGAYICPNDILLGRASATVPQGPFQESNNPRHRVEFCQKIVESFWKRWYRDVFPSLVPRRKWQTTRRDICVDDYVLIKETNPIRGQWKTGRVTKVFSGSDDRVRNVMVKTVTSEYERPITKIVVIYPAEGWGNE